MIFSKRIVIRFIFSAFMISMPVSIIAQTSEDDFLNKDFDDIIIEEDSNNNIKKGGNFKAFFELSLGNKFTYSPLRETIANPDNIFDLYNYEEIFYSDILAKVNFGNYFIFNIDGYFRSVLAGNELGNIRPHSSVNEHSFKFENKMREFYLSGSFPTTPSLKLTLGRTYFDPGNSYFFKVFNFLDYIKTPILPYDDDDKMGVNMLNLSLYFPNITFSLIYSPGIPEENSRVLEHFNIQYDQRFLFQMDIDLPYLKISPLTYLDSSLDWAFGLTLSWDAHRSLILYSDLSLTNGGSKPSWESSNNGLSDSRQTSEETVPAFTGTLLGINSTLGAVVNIIAELYLNTAGLNRSEQQGYFDNLKMVVNGFQNPSSPQAQGAYRSIMASFLTKYEVYDLGMLFLFLRVSKENLADTGINVDISSATCLLDGSFMLRPSITYSPAEYFYIDLYSNFFIGNEGSLFGEIPYISTIGLTLSFRF